MAWSFVCPGNRGIGYHLTRHLLLTTKLPVVATSRHNIETVKKDILQDLHDIDSKRLTVLELDVKDENSIERAASKAESLFPPSTHHLRLAFSIPGILYPEKSPSQLSHAHIQETFAVNTIGPLLLTKHFTSFLPKKSSKLELKDSVAEGLPPHAVWLNMAARVGSTTENGLGGWYSYRASKAGVFSVTKTLDLYLRSRSGGNAMAMAYHPGTVKTELSREFWGSVKEHQLFSPQYAVEKMMEVVLNSDLDRRGRCWDWQGEEIKP